MLEEEEEMFPLIVEEGLVNTRKDPSPMQIVEGLLVLSSMAMSVVLSPLRLAKRKRRKVRTTCGSMMPMKVETKWKIKSRLTSLVVDQMGMKMSRKFI